jgi:NitT/TauT family transport system substrate-binding protein
VLKGEADVAVGPAEFPLVTRAFNKEGIRAIGTVDKVEHIFFIGRKDRGIEQASDLRGKRVGTTVGTVAEFYLGRFLSLNGMKMQDITLVNLRTPQEWVNAVVDGDIDAVVTAQPHANMAREGLGANSVFWSAQSNQPMYALMIATDEWIAKHPKTVERFLKSLAQAEEYIVRNPAEAKAIVQKELNLDAAYIETVWSQNQYGLSLDQSLITAMEDEARWMIANNLTTEKTVPNFLDYIYEDALKAAKPEAVSIIR